jgi:transporter family-2 protein
MSRSVAIVIALAAGGLVGLQPPANALMAEHVGDYGAALMSLVFSIIVIATLLLTVGEPGRLAGLTHFRPEWVIGGLGGACIIFVGLVAIRPLGTGAVVALFVASQLIISVVADRLGLFGLHHPITAARVGGVILVILGTILVTRG